MKKTLARGSPRLGALALPFLFTPVVVLGVAVVLAVPGVAWGQGPGDLTVRDKTELFIQHIVKVSKIDPASYQALVLEYELGMALQELLHPDGEGEDPASADSPVGFVLVDFVERAIKEIHPAYANLVALLEAGKLEEAREAGRALAGSSDPYVAAHAALALAETDFRAAQKGGTDADFQGVMKFCERIVAKDRLYLIRDHRACELIALCFEKLKKPLLEFVQYAILLTDYNDLPKEVSDKAKARLAALNDEVGRPLGTVANWMNEVEKLLVKDVTKNDPTQRQETEIVSALDKLIELQEARERKT